MFSVFYSWLSDHRGQRQFIYKALARGLENARGKVCPTGEDPRTEIVECGRFKGRKDIVRFILDNIPKCHAYVVDVTFVNAGSGGKTRKTPNPNNMLEFGIALQALGENRCIPVFNTECGSLTDLPFDIRNLHVIEFDREDGVQPLARSVGAGLEHCLKDYLDESDSFRSQLSKCLATPILFNGQFLRSQFRGSPEDASIFLLSKDLRNTAAQRFEPLSFDFFYKFRKGTLSERAPNRRFTWSEGIAVLLTRMEADCERICSRHPSLSSASLYKQAKGMGEQARHFRGILSPMDKFDDPYFYEIFAEETVGFLNGLTELYLKVRDHGEGSS